MKITTSIVHQKRRIKVKYKSNFCSVQSLLCNSIRHLEYITDRDLRRLANKLKKDQWFRLAKLLSISDREIQEIDKLKIGKDEKAFRALSEWRTSAEEISGNQVSQLTFALEEVHRKDLVQFILHHRDMCKLRRKCIRI